MATNEENKLFDELLTKNSDPMEYSGTLPLTLEEFPVVKNADGTFSNILTAQYEVDGKIILIPTMRKGKVLSEKEIKDMIKNNEHFGIYNSKAEADFMDKKIHKDFKKLHGE